MGRQRAAVHWSIRVKVPDLGTGHSPDRRIRQVRSDGGIPRSPLRCLSRDYPFGQIVTTERESRRPDRTPGRSSPSNEAEAYTRTATGLQAIEVPILRSCKTGGSLASSRRRGTTVDPRIGQSYIEPRFKVIRLHGFLAPSPSFSPIHIWMNDRLTKVGPSTPRCGSRSSLATASAR